MKNLFIAFSILSVNTCFAQTYKPYNAYNTHADATSELSITAGPCLFDAGIAFSARLQFCARVADHLQVSPSLNFISGGAAGNLYGCGLNINVPIGKDRSYFYPGVQFGYFFNYGMSYGLHIGYTAYVDKILSINIEPELLFINYAGGPLTAVPIQAGVRFNL